MHRPAGNVSHTLSDRVAQEYDYGGGSNGKGDTNLKRSKTGNKLACSRCRGMKAKCELHEPPNGKCVRCTRLSYDCVWMEAQKRGRRANSVKEVSQQINNELVSAADLSSFQDDVSDQHYFPQPAPPPPPPPAPAPIAVNQPFKPASAVGSVGSTSNLTTNPSPNQHFTVRSLESPSQQQSHTRQITFEDSPVDPSPQSTSQRSIHRPSSLRDEVSPQQSTLPSLSMMDLAQAKERALHEFNAPHALPLPQKRLRTDPKPVSDPVDMRILSDLDAYQLFQHYHRKMNGFIILLDPFLHTVEHVRSTSYALFSTILAVSAKFIRPNLYQALLTHAKQLVGRDIIDGRVSLGLIQSILMQVYWKESDDSSAWIRVGEAIRMGYQMHLHRHRLEPLPDDEYEARLIMDRERTWIDLCAFDQTFYLQSAEEEDGFHQTCMIPHYRINVKDWLKETLHYGVTDDLEQGANFEWIKMQRLSRDIHRAHPGSARALGQHVQGTLEAAYRQYLNPSSPDAFAYETRQWIRVNYWLAAASLALARAMLIAIGNEGELLAEWVVASNAFVDALEIVAKHGYIQYWQDTLGITLYSMGEFSVKIFPDVYPATQKQIVGWIDRIHRACELCADGHTESTAAFISRFFQLCLRAVYMRSNTPEMASSHVGEGGTGGGALSDARVVSDNLQALPPHSYPPLPSNSFDDATYWESIFPGVSTDWSWLLQTLENDIQAE